MELKMLLVQLGKPISYCVQMVHGNAAGSTVRMIPEFRGWISWHKISQGSSYVRRSSPLVKWHKNSQGSSYVRSSTLVRDATLNHRHMLVPRRWLVERRQEETEEWSTRTDPVLFAIKGMIVASFFYCAWMIYPAVRNFMVDSGLALMRTKSPPMFAGLGLSRLRWSLQSRQACEEAFAKDNSNGEVLVRLLESDDAGVQEEALLLALHMDGLGCSCSVLHNAGADVALQRLSKGEDGKDDRILKLLEKIKECRAPAA